MPIYKVRGGLTDRSVVSYVRTTADLTVANNTFTAIPFPSEIVDTDGMWASGNNTRLTVQRKGTYMFVGEAEWTSDTSNHYLFIRRGGSEYLACQGGLITSASSCVQQVSLMIDGALEDQYFELVAYQLSAGNATVKNTSLTYFAAYLIQENL